MPKPLPLLDLDLLIEHGGHEAALTGSGRQFVAKFPTLASLFHFSRALWPWRRNLPSEYSIQVEWRGFRFPWRSS